MTRAFIVTLSVSDHDPSSDAGQAELIQESLQSDGIEVVSVIPYGQVAETQQNAPDTGGILQTPSPLTSTQPLW